MKRVTILDLAEKLQLSRNTVSKALSDGKVSYAVRITVLQKAYEMGYEKLSEEQKKEAREYRNTNEGGTILVLHCAAQSSFWNRILAGISCELGQSGYRMQMHIVDQNDYCAQKTLKIIGQDTRGIIMLSTASESFMEGLKSCRLPITMMGIPKNGEHFLKYGNVVTIEGRGPIEEITRKLIKRGMQVFSFIGYTQSMGHFMRFDGLRQTLSEHDIELNPAYVFTGERIETYYSFDKIYRMVEQMPDFPDVLFCADDDVAELAETALIRIDREKAKRTMIVGFDGTLVPDFFESSVITVAVDMEDFGKRLVRTTIDAIQRPEMEHILIMVTTHTMEGIR